MCMKKIYKDDEEKEDLKTLPKNFIVWKYCPKFYPEWRNVGGRDEPQYDKSKWYKAKNILARRMPIGYEAGYHAFLNREDAEDYMKGTITCSCIKCRKKVEDSCKYIIRFHARKKDIIHIGQFNEKYCYAKRVVLRSVKPHEDNPNMKKG